MPNWNNVQKLVSIISKLRFGSLKERDPEPCKSIWNVPGLQLTKITVPTMLLKQRLELKDLYNSERNQNMVAIISHYNLTLKRYVTSVEIFQSWHLFKPFKKESCKAYTPRTSVTRENEHAYGCMVPLVQVNPDSHTNSNLNLEKIKTNGGTDIKMKT